MILHRDQYIHSKPLFISRFQEPKKPWKTTLFLHSLMTKDLNISAEFPLCVLYSYPVASFPPPSTFLWCKKSSLLFRHLCPALFPPSAYTLISLPQTCLWSRTPSSILFFFFSADHCRSFCLRFSSWAFVSVCHPRPCVLSLLITERRLLCRHRSAEKDIAVKKKETKNEKEILGGWNKGKFQ